MDQQRWLQQQCNHVAPINRPVERVQFAAVVKTIKNKRNQAENVEVNRTRRVPSSHKNKQSDKKVKQRRNPQVVFKGRGIFLRSGDQRYLQGLAVAADSILYFHPRAGSPKQPRNVRGAMDFYAANAFHVVALLNPSSIGW